MKTTFSRNLTTAAIILLLALVLVGTTFQALVRDYLTDNAVGQLQQNSSSLADLAAAYCSDGSFSSREFLVNLDVVSEVTGTDAVICDARGRVVLCSDALTGCNHQGMRVDSGYLNKVFQNGGDVATGIIKGLYSDSRYVVSSPITDSLTGADLGIVIVSRPVGKTDRKSTRLNSSHRL